MPNRSFIRLTMVLSVVGVLVLAGVGVATLATSAAPTPLNAASVLQADTPPSNPAPADLGKLHPDLRDLAASVVPPNSLPGQVESAAAQEPLWIQIMVNTAFDQAELTRFFVDGKYVVRPALSKGEVTIQIVIGQVMPYSLAKIASSAKVDAVLPIYFEQNHFPERRPIDDPEPIDEPGPEDWAKLRAQAPQLQAGVQDWADARAFGDGRVDVQPRDWFEVMAEGPHKAEVAWARGYQGEGVTVAVHDDGVDPAHPDLMGTHKIYSSTVNPEYNGWPMVFSPFSQLTWLFQQVFGDPYVSGGYYSVHYVDTSATPSLSACGANISCFNFTPLIDFLQPGMNHTYVISDSMTTSGMIHVGTHPDFDLRDWVWGERPAVLVTDPNAPGVYDTVYVDLDNDYDFRDEKPLTRADVNNPATYNNMVAYRDLDGDGLADISGGMVYFIADGQSCIPAMDYMWGCGANDPLGQALIPNNGSLVAFSGSTFDRAYSHGTQCASNVVGQGRTDWLLPRFSDLPGSGVPAGAVYGMAPKARIVNVSDIYYNFDSSKLDAYLFSAVGYDGIDQTGYDVVLDTFGFDDTDAIQVTSNSYGSSDQDNDGWEYDGQYASQILRWWAPYQQMMFSTGNGAPAYGTTAPPSPDTAIAVGASTQMGSTGWDSITKTTQIMHSDVTPFSNRGPGARGTSGVDVVAGGAYAAGAEELNYYSISTWGDYDGNKSWVSWGGTSRSAPVAAGVMALIYQAYKDANGMWPDFETAKSLLMSSATDLNYDTFTQGAGSVNADRGTAVASGMYGVFVEDSAWEPGDYRGMDYPGFAHLVMPGNTYTKTFTVRNPTTDTLTVGVSDVEHELIKSDEFELLITPGMVQANSAYGAANRLSSHLSGFNYFIPLTATSAKIAQNSAWNKIQVPADADLMIVREVMDYGQFDVNGDYAADNVFSTAVYNWEDIDGDGRVWTDKDDNGVVNVIQTGETVQIDGAPEIDWTDSRTELDRWEFGRFAYNNPDGNRREVWVQNPLDRMIDGLFIGVFNYPFSTYTGTTTLRYRVDFYKETDAGWLSTSANSLNVPAGGSADFVATINVPGDIPTGVYQAAIKVADPGTGNYGANTSVVPVAMSVAAQFESGMQLGGVDSYTYDMKRPYNNGAVRGLFDWGWRAESGDWRFFFVDVDNRGVFTATLKPENEVHSVTSSASGTAVFTLTADSGRLQYTLNFTGIVTPTMAHIHRGAAGVNGPVAVWLYDATGVRAPSTIPAKGTVTLSPADVGLLLSGNTYVNVHSADYQAGEIRDQLHRADSKKLLTGNTKVLVKNEWDGQSPVTDIDTVVLGPQPSSMGTYFLDFPEPSYYGPYVLDTVGASPNTNAGGGVWIFNTSSGGNTDWISAPLRDGLHAFLSHNVLSQGDKLDVVFTKTLGTLNATPVVEINTYTDQVSNAEVVDIVSSLALSGLQVEAFGLGGPETMNNIPLPNAGGGFEWTQPLPVQHGAKIEIWTSSSNISDIDLYLFYCGPQGANCSQVAASLSGSADEYVSVIKPADGIWFIAIDNFSGPAGTFNLTTKVVQGYDLTVGNVPSGPIAADTPVSFTVGVSKTMEPGVSYEGVILAGTPDAPTLLEIPVIVNRVSAITKSVNKTEVFPGSEDVVYTLALRNISDTPATFTVTDPLPTGVEYVSSAGGATYNAGTRTVSFSGLVTTTHLLTITTKIAANATPGSTITNTATVAAPALFQGTHSDAAVVDVAELGAFGGSTLEASEVVTTGAEITYVLEVINSGESLSTVTVTGTVPAGTTFARVLFNPETQDFSYNAATQQVQWTGQIAPGDSRTFTWVVKVNEDSALYMTTITANALISADGKQVPLSVDTWVRAPHEMWFPIIGK